jgi:hypothetical protein
MLINNDLKINFILENEAIMNLLKVKANIDLNI